jgi:hypothetical protein
VPLQALSGCGWSAGQGGDLDQVVGEDPVLAPERCSLPSVQSGTVLAVTAFEVADPAFAAGAPLDEPMEAAAVLDGGIASA